MDSPGPVMHAQHLHVHLMLLLHSGSDWRFVNKYLLLNYILFFFFVRLFVFSTFGLHAQISICQFCAIHIYQAALGHTLLLHTLAHEPTLPL